MVPGWYIMDRIMIQAGNVIFVHDYFPPSESLLLPGARLHAIAGAHAREDSKRLLVWTAAHNLRADASPSESTDLSKSRSIVITVSNGQNSTFRGTISLRAASAGLRLHTAEAQARDDNAIYTTVAQPGIMSFGNVAPDTTLSVTVPFDLENDLGKIIVRIEVAYVTEKGEFSYASNAIVDLRLPLAVNVQDTFKANALFSRFTVGTATASPMRILRTSFRDSSDFEIITSDLSDYEHDVFTQQPLSLIAQIRHKAKRHKADRMTFDRRLHLEIHYRRLDQDIQKAITSSVVAEMVSTSLQQFSYVLSRHVTKALRTRFSMQDLERIGLLREIDVGDYSQYGWDGILEGIRPADAAELKKLLLKWHNVSQVTRNQK